MKLPWSERSYIEQSIGDRTFRFYEVDGLTAISCKKLVKAAVTAFATLTRNPREDAGSEVSEDTERLVLADSGVDALPATKRRKKLEQIPLEVIKYHDESRGTALNLLIDSMMEPTNLRELAGFVVASMRDEFEPGKKSPAELEEFLHETPLPLFTKLLFATLKANAETFGPFGKTLLTLLERGPAALEAALNKAQSKISGTESLTPSESSD